MLLQGSKKKFSNIIAMRQLHISYAQNGVPNCFKMVILQKPYIFKQSKGRRDV